MKTLRSIIEYHATNTPNAIAFIDVNETITYAELANRARQFAAGLHLLGIRKGDVVAVQLPNIIEYLIAYFAITWYGGIMTTIYMQYDKKEIETILTDSNAKAFICLSDNTIQVIVLGNTPNVILFNDLASTDPLNSNPYTPIGSDLFLLLYTSGTTSKPKGVLASYDMRLENSRLNADEHKITSNDRLILASSFSHMWSIYSINLGIIIGCSFAIFPKFAPLELVKTIASLKPTIFFGAPAHIAMCFEKGVFNDIKNISLTSVIVSGSSINPNLARKLIDQFPSIKFSQLWGMTETQVGLFTRPNDSIKISSQTVGKPAPDTKFRIVNDELQTKSPFVFSGYLNNEDLNNEIFTEDGWFKTGDLATINENGFFTITGRIKDIINRGGVKYHPGIIEETLNKHPKIQQSAIAPIPDDILGEKACAYIVSNDNITLDEICDYLLLEGIAKMKLPEQLKIIDKMPVGPTNKIIKGNL